MVMRPLNIHLLLHLCIGWSPWSSCAACCLINLVVILHSLSPFCSNLTLWACVEVEKSLQMWCVVCILFGSKPSYETGLSKVQGFSLDGLKTSTGCSSTSPFGRSILVAGLPVGQHYYMFPNLGRFQLLVNYFLASTLYCCICIVLFHGISLSVWT